MSILTRPAGPTSVSIDRCTLPVAAKSAGVPSTAIAVDTGQTEGRSGIAGRAMPMAVKHGAAQVAAWAASAGAPSSVALLLATSHLYSAVAGRGSGLADISRMRAMTACRNHDHAGCG